MGELELLKYLPEDLFDGKVVFITGGREARNFLDEPLTLGPLATAEFLIETKDTSGGSGANFIVEWKGESDLNPPHIETVMMGMDGTQGIAFVGQAQEIEQEM